MIEQFEKLLAEGKDSVILRFGLGNAYLNDKQPDQAIVHLKACLEQDPNYSAAWKLLGKAYSQSGDNLAAVETYEQGIVVAEEQGDVQAAREMRVFARKLNKNSG